MTDRIAVVVARHSAVTGLGYSRTRCGCGEVFSAPFVKSHAAHVAEQIVKATEFDVDEVAEAMADADDGIIFGLLTPDEAEFYRRMARAAMRVSAWSAVEEKP